MRQMRRPKRLPEDDLAGLALLGLFVLVAMSVMTALVGLYPGDGVPPSASYLTNPDFPSRPVTRAKPMAQESQ
jgi:hypothetical protein